MFLLTFALLVISMLGVYTQVYALEAARLLANQSTVGQSMLIWHEVAATYAGNVMNPATAISGGAAIDIKGCSLTPSLKLTGLPGNGYCQTGAGVTGGAAPVLAITSGPYNIGLNSYSSLPPVYNTTSFQWNSLAFQSNGAYNVITYVSAPPGKVISTATATPTQLNLTEGDLYHQLQNLNIPLYSFGYVSNPTGAAATLNAGSNGFTATSQYSVPPSIPNGALAIISFPGQCGGC